MGCWTVGCMWAGSVRALPPSMKLLPSALSVKLGCIKAAPVEGHCGGDTSKKKSEEQRKAERVETIVPLLSYTWAPLLSSPAMETNQLEPQQLDPVPTKNHYGRFHTAHFNAAAFYCNQGSRRSRAEKDKRYGPLIPL